MAISGLARRSHLPLADRVMAGITTRRVEPRALPVDSARVAGWMRQRMINARRYMLDEEAALAVQELGVTHPDVLLQIMRKARAPFRYTWLEWPLSAMASRTAIQDEDSPDRVGVFIESLDEERPLYRLTSVSVAMAEASPVINVAPVSVVYDLNREEDTPLVSAGETRLLNEVLRFPISEVTKFLLGGAYMIKGDQAEVALRQQQCDAIARHANLGITPVAGDVIMRFMERNRQSDELRRVVYHNLKEGVGTWRFAISALALINAREYVEHHPWAAGTGRRFVGGRTTAFLQHYVVRLTLPRETVVQRVTREAAIAMPRPRHPVVGHYAHSRKFGDPTCEHVYALETQSREVCVLCRAKRWWVKDHHRGDASVGFITRDYNIELRR